MAEKTLNKLSLGSKGKTSVGTRTKNSMVFAFDFGEYAVKVAVFKVKRNKVTVRYLFTVENNENLGRLDMSNYRSWRTLIAKAFSSRNILMEDHFAVASIGGKYFIHRQMEIPFVDEKDRTGMVENEMSQLLALDASAYTFQHELLGTKGEGDEKKCIVWAAAMPRETCNAAYELLNALGLRPLALDIHCNGIRRFLTQDEKYAKTVAGHTVACIDYGMTHTELAFVRDGKLLADTMLDMGDERLVAEARSALGARITDPNNAHKIIVSPQEICNILNKAHTTPEERSFSVFVKEWLTRINTAITRFNYDHPEEPVELICMYGGSPQLIWLSQYVASVTHIPSEIISQSTLFEGEGQLAQAGINYQTYLNVLNLALMD